jgi:hypothetical protein
MMIRDFWDIAPCVIVGVDRRFRGSYCFHHQCALIMEAIRTSETSVYSNYTTQHYIPEGSDLNKQDNLMY